MEDYLESVNGKNWRIKQRHMLASLMNAKKPKYKPQQLTLGFASRLAERWSNGHFIAISII